MSDRKYGFITYICTHVSVFMDCVLCDGDGDGGAALLYVTAVVPVRVGFGVDVQLGSGAWWFDAAVDLYFITDLILNFRTAVWLPDGTLEVSLKKIRAQYLRGWFAVDLLSCLPIQYIGLIITCAAGICQSKGAESKSVKVLRLLRLGKLLRLARIKRLLKKWEDVVDITPYLGTRTLSHVVIRHHLNVLDGRRYRYFRGDVWHLSLHPHARLRVVCIW